MTGLTASLLVVLSTLSWTAEIRSRSADLQARPPSSSVLADSAPLETRGRLREHRRASPETRGVSPETQGASPITMRMLMEATIFQIDVLTLELRIGGAAGDGIRSLAETRERTEATADSVADLAADARRAHARLDFLRDISLDRFLDEVGRNATLATEAGYISAETGDFILRSLPEWYAFLEGRGIEEGDRMEYVIEGDTLTVRYLSRSDSLLMSTTDVGPERRRSVLGGYFARGSDFREGLLDSLFRRVERGAP